MQEQYNTQHNQPPSKTTRARENRKSSQLQTVGAPPLPTLWSGGDDGVTKTARSEDGLNHFGASGWVTDARGTQQNKCCVG